MPSGTVVLRGAHNESWIVVAACLRSVRRTIAALHPKQAHDDATPVANTEHLKLTQCANGTGKRKEYLQPAGLTWEYWHFRRKKLGVFVVFWGTFAIPPPSD